MLRVCLEACALSTGVVGFADFCLTECRRRVVIIFILQDCPQGSSLLPSPPCPRPNIIRGASQPTTDLGSGRVPREGHEVSEAASVLASQKVAGVLELCDCCPTLRRSLACSCRFQ